jgi:hypothetical protein
MAPNEKLTQLPHGHETESDYPPLGRPNQRRGNGTRCRRSREDSGTTVRAEPAPVRENQSAAGSRHGGWFGQGREASVVGVAMPWPAATGGAVPERFVAAVRGDESRGAAEATTGR